MAWSNKEKDIVGAKVRAAATAAVLALVAGAASAADPVPGGIYTCVDSKGRRLTADRPIVDCIDREQTEMTPGGLTRRKIGPTLTAAERAAEEEKARRLEEARESPGRPLSEPRHPRQGARRSAGAGGQRLRRRPHPDPRTAGAAQVPGR
jgi:hypothetical protein